LLGKSAGSLGGGRDGLNARAPDGDRAWLAAGRVTVPTEPARWVTREVVNVSADDVRRVSIQPPQGTAVTAIRSESGADLTLQDVPAGQKPKGTATVNALAFTTEYLDLQDARRRPASLEDPIGQFRVETFDGLVVEAAVHQLGADQWIAFAASGPEGVAEAARAINDRTADWLYQVPEHKANRLTGSLEDLVEPEEPQS